MMKTKTLQQIATFTRPPHDIYELLMDSAQHSAFTGEPAVISREAGGIFTAYGDYISGKNLELIPDQKIVQFWRASDWPEGHFSTVMFEIMPIVTGTKLVFTQTNVPLEFAKSIGEGWKEFYWEKMKNF